VSRIPGPSRAVGTAAGSTLALALLVCGCVFAAMAGPALSLHTQSQALHQTLAGLAATTDAVQVTAQFQDFGSGRGLQIMNGSATREIGQGFSALRLPLAAGSEWEGLSTGLLTISGAGPRANAALPPQLEVFYRDPLPSNARLTAGTYATARVPAGAVGVVATTQMAYRFGLHPGSRLSLGTTSGTVWLYVTGIVAERAPASAFWTQDPTIGTPSLNQPGYWVGGVIADPNQFVAMQNVLTGPGLEMTWEFPLDVAGVTADTAQGLYDALNRATTTVPSLTGALAPEADKLTVTSPLLADLSLFLNTQAAIETVLLLLFVSLMVIGAAVILIAAQMIVGRREAELAILRARGGSLWQVAAVTARTAVLAAVPATVIGAGLAIVLIPGGKATSSAAGWWLAGVAVAAALAGPPLVAAWQYRKPAPAADPALVTTAETGRPRPAWRRPVAELTGCAAAAAGLVVLHDQGVPAGGGIDLYLTITPVLVAIPVVVIMLRLYPLAVRGLLRLSAHGTGATGFVAMSRAAQSSLTGVLPAFALVLALSLATFAGMTSNGITRGEIAASWHTTGADVVIDAGPFPITPSALSVITAVRGVRHATAVWSTTWVTPSGQPLTVVAVDPAAYAAMVADTPFPAFPATAIGATPGGVRSSGRPVAVLASPDAAAALGRGATQLTSSAPVGPFTVRVAGTVNDTPAEPDGGTFVMMPLERLPGPTGQPAPNVVLVTGSGINDTELAAVAARVIPQAQTSFRSAALASLAGSPLQHGAVLIIGLTIATAAAFGLFSVMLGLALGSAERELTLARLTVMGHERETGLVLAEAMPALIAAVVAGAACALALPYVVGSSIDLSAFTGTNAPVQFQPDAVALGLPAAGILILALAVLTAQARGLRRRDITGMLRAQLVKERRNGHQHLGPRRGPDPHFVRPRSGSLRLHSVKKACRRRPIRNRCKKSKWGCCRYQWPGKVQARPVRGGCGWCTGRRAGARHAAYAAPGLTDRGNLQATRGLLPRRRQKRRQRVNADDE
jgi:putative ABC transport system permease protein